eukprot:19717-Rhodomonas_salina.4
MPVTVKCDTPKPGSTWGTLPVTMVTPRYPRWYLRPGTRVPGHPERYLPGRMSCTPACTATNIMIITQRQCSVTDDIGCHLTV